MNAPTPDDLATAWRMLADQIGPRMLASLKHHPAAAAILPGTCEGIRLIALRDTGGLCVVDPRPDGLHIRAGPARRRRIALIDWTTALSQLTNDSPTTNPEPTMTATATKPKANRKPPAAAKSNADPFDGPKADDQSAILPVDLIDPSPHNERDPADYTAAELETLAADIAINGLQQPITVRPKPDGRYEIIGGQRRWTAHQRANMPTIRVTIREVDDAQALWDTAAENALRKNLDPIAQARLLQKLTAPKSAGGAGVTQAEAGKLFGGLSQSTVANQIRLLKLRPEFQAALISGEILPSHGRELLAIEQLPKAQEQMLAAITARELPAMWSGQEWPPSKTDFADAVQDVIRETTERVDGQRWDSATGQHIKLNPTAAERERLGIVTIGSGADAKELITNIEEFERLMRDRIDKARAKAGKKAAAKPTATAKAAMTPAEQKAARLEAAAAAKRSADERAKRIDGWKTDWLRVLIAAQIGNARGEIVEIIFAWLATSWLPERYQQRERRERAAKAAGVPIAKGASDEAAYKTLITGSTTQCLNYIDAWLITFFVDEKGEPVQLVYPETVAAIAADLQIDVAAEWKHNRAGRLTEAFYQIHTTDELLRLADETNDHLEGKTKAARVAELLSFTAPYQLPRSLADKPAKAAKPTKKK